MHVENQQELEWMFNRKNVRKKLLAELKDTQEIVDVIPKCIALLEDWYQEDHYASKRNMLDELWAANPSIEDLIWKVFCVIVPKDIPTSLVNVVGEVAAALHLSDKPAAARIAASLIVILCESDVYDLIAPTDPSQGDTWKVVSNFLISEELQTFIMQTQYLPPMICKPRIVKSNYDNGYLTYRDSMILGKGNYHEGDICLDSINKFNQIPLTLNLRLLTTLSERPKNQFKDMKQREQWLRFVRKSYEIYKMINDYGNEFYLTHRVDKRGRTYAQGYHISTQGNSFRKAMIQFAEPELVEGV